MAKPTPWETNEWFVSYLNYEDEVRSKFSFANQIKIHDVTLRDGEQQAGLVLRKDEKVRIAEKLAEVGVHRIEAGMPLVSKDEEAAIKEIVKRDLGPEIFTFARCMKPDVDAAVDCGAKGIVIEIPSSKHLIEYAYGWTLDRAIDLSIEATAYAKEKGLYVVFFPIDGTRAEIGWFLDLIERVAREGHMDALGIVDTFGVLSPHATDLLVRRIKQRIDKPLEAHFHDDFGMGVANTIVALAAGVEVMHTTVTSVGERAGNAAMEDIVISLLTMYGVDLGLKYDKLYELSKLVRELMNFQVRPNRPIIGDEIFKVEAGIIASWVLKVLDKKPNEMYPFLWSLVGQDPPEILLGKWSGTASVEHWLNQLGVSFDEDQLLDITMKVKEKGLSEKRRVSPDEFKAIVDQVLSA